MKYSKEIVKTICDLKSHDSYTIPEICAKVGITETTYHEWKARKPEFSEALKSAEHEFLSKISVIAKNSLAKKVAGYDYDEVSTTIVEGKDGKPRIKDKKTVKKHVPPDTAAVIFALTNTDSENFKNTRYHDLNINEKKRVAALFPTEEEMNEQETD